jgi:hypothetical protein
MVDQLSGCEADKVLDAPLRTIVGCLAEVLPKGPAQTALYWVAGLCIIAAPVMYKYYIGILAQGAAPEGSIERQDYDKLRASLAARLYAKWLTAFLDRVERFFGDAGMADRTLFPHAFGLKKAAPLWTAPAFDRCLLLALIYPIATIFVIWAISGHVGPAEAALGLDNNFPAWRRGLIAALIGVVILIWQRKLAVAWAIVGACAAFGVIFAATGLGENPSTPAVVSVFIVVLFGSYGLKGALQGTLQGTHGATAFFLVFTQVVLWTFSGHPPIMPRIGAQACAVVFAIVSVVGVAVLAIIALIYRWQGVFFSLFLPAMILACLVAADLLSHKETWGDFGPLLLFLGLLTLLNAPFDWASLGLTRALLRRGLELDGWWSSLLALVDAALASIIIALLALTMVIGLQAFDDLAVHGGGKLSCRWTPSSTASPIIRRHRNIGGPMRSCSRP